MENKEDHWERVELHCHTQASPDSLVTVEGYLRRCKKLGITKVAITDHNVIKAALAAKEKAPEMVIVGEEIQTSKGELLGYFMTEWVPPGLDPFTTIRLLRDQGAVISIPHPFDPFRGRGWTMTDLEALVPHVDALEVFNARCYREKSNLQAESFAGEHHLLGTVGSDAHSITEIGRAVLYMPSFVGPYEFIDALKKAQMVIGRSPWFVHLFSRYASVYKKLLKIVHG